MRRMAVRTTMFDRKTHNHVGKLQMEEPKQDPALSAQISSRSRMSPWLQKWEHGPKMQNAPVNQVMAKHPPPPSFFELGKYLYQLSHEVNFDHHCQNLRKPIRVHVGEEHPPPVAPSSNWRLWMIEEVAVCA